MQALSAFTQDYPLLQKPYKVTHSQKHIQANKGKVKNRIIKTAVHGPCFPALEEHPCCNKLLNGTGR